MTSEECTSIETEVLDYDAMDYYPLNLYMINRYAMENYLREQGYKPMEISSWQDPKKCVTVVRVDGIGLRKW